MPYWGQDPQVVMHFPAFFAASWAHLDQYYLLKLPSGRHALRFVHKVNPFFVEDLVLVADNCNAKFDGCS